MGIMATDPSSTEERIIVSQDKDMKTIPGLLYRPFDEDPEVQEISLIEADRFHLWQTIVGDAVDGYPGCPGAGPVAADKALDLFQGVGPIHREITRGPRKGTIVTTWEAREFDTAWEALVSLYHKAGQGEADAIRQARLARILRFDEYDGRPILWTPPRAN
jgi:DNA polymerase-1